MPWTYHQKSGAWHDPQGTLMHYGYSGHFAAAKHLGGGIGHE